MALLFTTYGIFEGTSSGTSKNSGKPWICYNFRSPEDMNGIQASPEQMRECNLRIFPPNKPNCDFNQLIPGCKYDLKIAVSTTGNFNLLSFNERK